MASWTVLTRTVAGDTAEQAAGRTVFVREKFSWVTLFFAPIVLLRFRLWLVFAAYVAVAVLVSLAEIWGGLAAGGGAGNHGVLPTPSPPAPGQNRAVLRRQRQKAAPVGSGLLGGLWRLG